MKRLLVVGFIAMLCTFIGLVAGIALGTRVGLRLVFAHQAEGLRAYVDLASDSANAKKLRNHLLYDIVGIQSELDRSIFDGAAQFTPHLLIAAFRKIPLEREQYRLNEELIKKNGGDASLWK